MDVYAHYTHKETQCCVIWWWWMNDGSLYTNQFFLIISSFHNGFEFSTSSTMIMWSNWKKRKEKFSESIFWSLSRPKRKEWKKTAQTNTANILIINKKNSWIQKHSNWWMYTAVVKDFFHIYRFHFFAMLRKKKILWNIKFNTTNLPKIWNDYDDDGYLKLIMIILFTFKQFEAPYIWKIILEFFNFECWNKTNANIDVFFDKNGNIFDEWNWLFRSMKTWNFGSIELKFSLGIKDNAIVPWL